METVDFLTRSQVLIVAGKGGVGKTVTAGALARAGARRGLNVLLVEIDGKTGLVASFGLDGPLAYEERVLVPGGAERDGVIEADLIGRTITPDEALLEYLRDHGLQRVSNRLLRTGAVEVAATAAPGLKDLLVLGKVRQQADRPEIDLVILDAPAAGHAISILRSPRGLLDSVSGGPVHAQANEVLELLADPRRCQVMLVTLPEETPVNETIETAFSLEEEVGVQLAPVVVNQFLTPVAGLDVDPVEAASAAGVKLTKKDAAALAEAARFRAGVQDRQAEQVDRLAALLPLQQLQLPQLLGREMTLGPMDLLADHLDHSVASLDEELLG